MLTITLIPMNFKRSVIVSISFTNGILLSTDSLAKIEAAKIGNAAFLDPEIEIVPDINFFPLIISFALKKFIPSVE